MADRWTPTVALVDTPGGEPSESHLWGTVRDRDGNALCPTRSVTQDPSAAGRRLLLNGPTPDHAGLGLLPEGRATARGAPAAIARDSDAVVIRSAADADGRPWEIQADGRSLRWLEDGILELRGLATGPGLAWELAGHGDDQLRYELQIFDVTGELLGRDVAGFIGFDRIHLPPGGDAPLGVMIDAYLNLPTLRTP